MPGTYSKFSVDVVLIEMWRDYNDNSWEKKIFKTEWFGSEKQMCTVLYDWTFFAGLRNSKKLPHEISAWNYILLNVMDKQFPMKSVAFLEGEKKCMSVMLRFT